MIVLTAFGSIESAADAMEEGALYYFTKPFDEEKIISKVKRYMRISDLLEEGRIHREELSASFNFSNIVAESQQMLLFCSRPPMSRRARRQRS